jgi:hypothetical protein
MLNLKCLSERTYSNNSRRAEQDSEPSCRTGTFARTWGCDAFIVPYEKIIDIFDQICGNRFTYNAGG